MSDSLWSHAFESLCTPLSNGKGPDVVVAKQLTVPPIFASLSSHFGESERSMSGIANTDGLVTVLVSERLSLS